MIDNLMTSEEFDESILSNKDLNKAIGNKSNQNRKNNQARKNVNKQKP